MTSGTWESPGTSRRRWRSEEEQTPQDGARPQGQSLSSPPQEEEPPTAPHLPGPLCAQEPSIAGPGPDTRGSPAGLGSDMEDLTAGAGAGEQSGIPAEKGHRSRGWKQARGLLKWGKGAVPRGSAAVQRKGGGDTPSAPSFSPLPRGALGPRLPPIVQSGKLKSTSRWPRPSADISARWPGPPHPLGTRSQAPRGPPPFPPVPPWLRAAPAGRQDCPHPGLPRGGSPRPVPATSAHRTRPRSASAQLRPSPRPRRSDAVRSACLPGTSGRSRAPPVEVPARGGRPLRSGRPLRPTQARRGPGAPGAPGPPPPLRRGRALSPLPLAACPARLPVQSGGGPEGSAQRPPTGLGSRRRARAAPAPAAGGARTTALEPAVGAAGRDTAAARLKEGVRAARAPGPTTLAARLRPQTRGPH